MERQFPVYTQETVCQDCYKCVRECPVKAIRLENQRAQVIVERCVACGHCIEICPSGAKSLRNDVGRAKFLLASGVPTYVSLAPSWVAVYPDWTAGQLIAALRRLGFAGVSETALGAQQVSAAVNADLASAKPGLYISSACPAVVDLVRKHIPRLTPNITPIASPALTHCSMLRSHFGENINVVFIGPCAAKKNEADSHPELMSLALTFKELDAWFAEQSVRPQLFSPGPDDVFVPESAQEGALYPIDGGMAETMRHYDLAPGVRTEAMSGLKRILPALEDTDPADMAMPFFLEGLGCRGGCVNGPCTNTHRSTIRSINTVRDRARMGPGGPRSGLRLEVEYSSAQAGQKEWTQQDITEALSRVGKTKKEDELNCGACGYDSCRSLAVALLNGSAEISMCASYMRHIAQRKANALLRCMPSGVVIVGSDMKVIESNRAFAVIAGEQWPDKFDANPGLPGSRVEDMLPIDKLLRAALRSGEEIHRDHMKIGDRLLDVRIFIIEDHQTAGAVVYDVTQSELRRDQIAKRAREVINRNIAAVQEIACRLGEHMADTEILLNSIAQDYAEEEDAGHEK